MKINISVKATPQEIREVFGLPDIQDVQGSSWSNFSKIWKMDRLIKMWWANWWGQLQFTRISWTPSWKIWVLCWTRPIKQLRINRRPFSFTLKIQTATGVFQGILSLGKFPASATPTLIPVLWESQPLSFFFYISYLRSKLTDAGDSALGTDRETLRDQLGLNDPWLFSTEIFWWSLQGDWGTSLLARSQCLRKSWSVPATTELMFGAMVVTILVAMPLGLIAAVNKGTGSIREQWSFPC